MKNLRMAASLDNGAEREVYDTMILVPYASEQNDFSNSDSPCCPDTKLQLNPEEILFEEFQDGCHHGTISGILNFNLPCNSSCSPSILQAHKGRDYNCPTSIPFIP